MSNLLSSLIARTTETAVPTDPHQAVILQPRPRALFETETPAAVPALPTESLETAESAAQPIQPPAPAEPRRHKPDRSAQPKPAAKKQPATERAPSSQPPARSPLRAAQTSLRQLSAVPAPKPAPTPDRPPHIQPVVVETRLVREQPILRPQIQRIVAPETAVSTALSAGVTDIKPGQSARLDATPIPPLPKIEAPTAKSASPTIPTTIITNLVEPKAIPRQPEAIVPTQTIPHLPAEQKRPLPDAMPEPVIQVHIGRIEVRAASPETAPSPKKQRQLPVMGLDDYLRQRNAQGGKP